MAKITENQRISYQHNIKNYKNKIDEIKKAANLIKIEINKNSDKEPVLQFKIANLTLNSITILCSMNESSVHLLEVKNTGFLEKARQQVYEAIIIVEKIVTNYLNVPFSDYSEHLEKLTAVSDEQKLLFLKKLGYCIDLVKKNFGDNTKWKWSYVEIDGRFAVISKNLLDLKRYQKFDEPSQEGYYHRKEHFSITQKILYDASQGYREKFELSTKNIDDLNKAIEFQKSLLRLNMISGHDEKILKCKKCIEVWTNLMEKYMTEKEEEKKKRQLSR